MNLWRLSELTDYKWLPNQIEQMPAYLVDEWMEYLEETNKEKKNRDK